MGVLKIKIKNKKIKKQNKTKQDTTSHQYFHYFYTVFKGKTWFYCFQKTLHKMSILYLKKRMRRRIEIIDLGFYWDGALYFSPSYLSLVPLNGVLHLFLFGLFCFFVFCFLFFFFLFFVSCFLFVGFFFFFC
jgi:hypothetical protein